MKVKKLKFEFLFWIKKSNQRNTKKLGNKSKKMKS